MRRLHAVHSAESPAPAAGASGSVSADSLPGVDETTKRILRLACEHHKRGQTGVALAIGMKPKMFAKRCDPAEDRSLTISLLALIALRCPRVAESFLERFTEAFRPEATRSPATLEQLLHRAHVELSDVDRELLKASDLTPEKLARLRVEARESREAAEAIEQKLAELA